MALSPDEIRQIVELVLATIAPYSIAGLVAGIVAGTIVSLTMAKRVVIPGAKKEVIDAMTDPKGKVAELRAAELKRFEESIDAKLEPFAPLLQTTEVEENGKKFQANALLVQLSTLVDLANDLVASGVVSMKDEHGNDVQVPLGRAVPIIVRTEISNARKAGAARGDGGGGATTAIELALEDGVWAAEHPEQAEALAIAHQSIDAMAQVFNWDEKKIAKLHKQANDLAVQGQDIKNFVDRLQNSRLMQGGQSGGGGQVGGGSVRPLGR